MKSLWAESQAVQLPDAMVEAGMKDEASACRSKPTANGDACVLVVAAFQPNIRAMGYYEMLGRPFGIGPAFTNRNR